MALQQASLTPVDTAEVTILVDSFVDVLLNDESVARRPRRPPDYWDRDKLRAEHGYALLLTVTSGGQRASVLYDAGMGRDTVLHNMDVLELRPRDLRALVLSHGHPDHHSGLEGILRRLGRRGLPLLLHPDAWRQRRVEFPSGEMFPLPPPNRADLEAEGVDVVEERGPSLLLDDSVLVSGETQRATPYEQGMRGQQALLDDRWEPDPWTWDDQALVVHVRGRGLVVLSSCSHSGVVNVLRNAQRSTGIDHIHGFVGGLHLSGRQFEPIIGPTVQDVVALQPDHVVPGHCSGWRATSQLAAALPQAYVHSSVGTRLVFGADDADQAASGGRGEDVR